MEVRACFCALARVAPHFSVASWTLAIEIDLRGPVTEEERPKQLGERSVYLNVAELEPEAHGASRHNTLSVDKKLRHLAEPESDEHSGDARP